MACIIKHELEIKEEDLPIDLIDQMELFKEYYNQYPLTNFNLCGQLEILHLYITQKLMKITTINRNNNMDLVV